MKICYLLTSLENAGPIAVARDLVDLLIDAGHECCVFYFKEKYGLEFKCPVYKLSMKDVINFNDYDVIHCHGVRPDLYVLLRKPLRCKAKIVTTLHSYVFRDHIASSGKIYGTITALACLLFTLRSDKIITLSNDAKKYYSRFLAQNKLEVVYNTRMCKMDCDIEEDLLNRIIALKQNNILLGTNCVLIKRKNLKAIIEVLPRMEHVRFCICGDGPLKQELVEYTKQLNITDRVLFIGKQPQAHRFLRLYDVYVMPSLSEGCPLGLLEAAQYGKAIACTDLPVIKEMFTNEEVSLFSLSNSQDVLKGLMSAIENRFSFGIKARQKFYDCYSNKCFFNSHMRIYTEG